MRVAIITGGMGGLGDSISTKMHASGYRVVVTHSPANTKAKEWISEHKASGREFSAYPVRKSFSCDRFYGTTETSAKLTRAAPFLSAFPCGPVPARATTARMSKFKCLRTLVAEPNQLGNRLFFGNVTMP